MMEVANILAVLEIPKGLVAVEDRKKQLCEYLALKYEALEFWESLGRWVNESAAKIKEITRDIEIAKEELNELRRVEKYFAA